jgi:hypothetical protein
MNQVRVKSKEAAVIRLAIDNVNQKALEGAHEQVQTEGRRSSQTHQQVQFHLKPHPRHGRDRNQKRRIVPTQLARGDWLLCILNIV